MTEVNRKTDKATGAKLGQFIADHKVGIIWAVTIILILIALALFAFGVLRFGWGWTGFSSYRTMILEGTRIDDTTIKDASITFETHPAKTLWDWMGLLIIPFVLAILAYMFKRIESGREEERKKIEQAKEEEHKKLERELEQDRQREAILQTYLDQMKDLLLEKHLLKSKSQDGVRAIARTLTVVTMRRLDRRRNETLLRFLDEAGVTKKDEVVIHFEKADLSKIDLNQTVLPALDLSKADLREANLSRARLREANLTETILYWANLTETNLNEANLTKAKLRKANLTEATLYRANLTEANLIEADLREAILAGADLRGAILAGANLHRADLTGAKYDDATKWPEGFNAAEAGAIEVGV